MYVRTRVGRLFYEERGEARAPDAPAIVLLHGLLFDGGSWRHQLEPLAELGRVVVIDGPGHGKSEPPPKGFSLEDHVEALSDVLRELGIERAVLCGLSWGGMLSMRFAIRFPSKIAGLVLLDTSAESEGRGRRVRYRSFIALHRALGMPRWLYERQVKKLMFGDATLRERQDLVEESYVRTMGFDREGVARAALAVVVDRTDVTKRLGEIRAPTLVLVGRDDRSTPLAKAEALARRIERAELHVVEGAGHMSALEQPVAVNALVVPFVRRVLGG